MIAETEGNKREAARRLGVAPGTLYRLMKKLKIYTGDKHPHAAQNPQPLPAGTIRRTVVAAKAK